MDTTKQNILMLEKAMEIQKLWKPVDGDWYTSKETINRTHYPWLYYNIKPTKGFINNHIWLPRQDQLQGMVVYKSVTKEDDIHIKIEKFYQFVNKVMGAFNSMEQLWLAFVMKEKYNKIWSGKDWEKV